MAGVRAPEVTGGGTSPAEGGRMDSGPPLADPPDPARSVDAEGGGAGVGVEGGAGVVGAEWVDAGGYWVSLRPDMCGCESGCGWGSVLTWAGVGAPPLLWVVGGGRGSRVDVGGTSSMGGKEGAHMLGGELWGGRPSPQHTHLKHKRNNIISTTYFTNN